MEDLNISQYMGGLGPREKAIRNIVALGFGILIAAIFLIAIYVPKEGLCSDNNYVTMQQCGKYPGAYVPIMNNWNVTKACYANY